MPWTSSEVRRKSAPRLRTRLGYPLVAERRKSMRYNIRMKLRFTVPHPNGGASVSRAGRSVDISSHGILFTSPQRLAAGQAIEGSIIWPVAQAGSIPMTLEFKGVVVRSTGARIAIEIARHEFLAKGALSGAASSDPGAPCVMAAGS